MSRYSATLNDKTSYEIIRGETATIVARIFDPETKSPLTLTGFTCTAYFRKEDGTWLSKVGTPVDNILGKVSFALTSAESASLVPGPGNVEIVAASASVTTIVQMKDAISVVSRLSS